jgi:hypothetical protein
METAMAKPISKELRAFRRLLSQHGGYLVFMDGWRCVALVKTGRKWNSIRFVDGSKQRLTVTAWAALPKRALVKHKGMWQAGEGVR